MLQIQRVGQGQGATRAGHRRETSTLEAGGQPTMRVSRRSQEGTRGHLQDTEGLQDVLFSGSSCPFFGTPCLSLKALCCTKLPRRHRAPVKPEGHEKIDQAHTLIHTKRHDANDS